MGFLRNFLMVLICLSFLIPKATQAKRGCCSHHGGVCGNMCCDGTPLSPACGGSSSWSTGDDSWWSGAHDGNNHPVPSTPDFCSKKNYCYQMDSCEEAMRYYEECGKRNLDADGDGIPCEQLCGGGEGNGRGECSVVEVIDGDTLDVSYGGTTKRVRLIGIDTPEKFHSNKLTEDATRCGVSERYIIQLGELASSHIRSLVSSDSFICKEYGRGYYGRYLMEIESNIGSINEKMVADGYACVYKKSDLPEFEMQKLVELMEEAREYRKGLWGVDYELMSCLCGLEHGPVHESSSPGFVFDGSVYVSCSQSSNPVVSDVPSSFIPFGVGNYHETGVLRLVIQVPRFEEPVDVYLGVVIPSGVLLIFSHDRKWTYNIEPLFIATNGGENVEVGSYPTETLPRGKYTLYLLVVPTGKFLDGNPYYLWSMDFVIR